AAAAASGTVYTSRPVYRLSEVVIIILKTPTGINDTRILVARVWRFALGVAGLPQAHGQSC
ncbi:MAG: hypothetical protein QW390_01040, partial [Candidatus Bathyarchaeia archaeon]